MTPVDEALAALAFWEQDPLPQFLVDDHPKNLARLAKGQNTLCVTATQREAINCPRANVIMEGGNQSGKTRSACLKVVLYALEQAEDCKAGEDVNIWYTTTTYDKFAEQAWGHFKTMLLFPGEKVLELPTTRITAITWIKRAPETCQYFAVQRPSGATAHIYIHTYAQGRAEFQAQSVDFAVIDEECPEDIYQEIKSRMLARPGARCVIACTPVLGEPWLERVRKEAEVSPRTAHFRFNTKDNPGANKEEIADQERMYADQPEYLKLRLEGFPYTASGLVYPDGVFRSGEHVIAPHEINQQHWTLNRCIDAGYRYPACVWIAVRSDNKQVVVYRSWKGRDMTIAEAAAQIKALSAGEVYYHDLIDPEVRAKSPETGETELSVWQSNGIDADPAFDNTVRAGIERLRELMTERVEVAGPGGRSVKIPRFRVFSTCEDWLDERRRYKFKNAPENRERNLKSFEIIKRDDHVLDPTRLLVSAGLKFVADTEKPPQPGTQAYVFWEMRHKKKRA